MSKYKIGDEIVRINSVSSGTIATILDIRPSAIVLEKIEYKVNVNNEERWWWEYYFRKCTKLDKVLK